MKLSSTKGSRRTSRRPSRRRSRHEQKKGIIAVISAFALTAVFAFCALSIDVGRMMSTQTSMQNAVDAAALAASQEISAVIWESAESGGSINYSSAVAAARAVADDVADRNGVYIDPDEDVVFGRRAYDASAGTWPITWGQTPYNVVKVTASKDNSDPTAEDAQFPLTFGWAVGTPTVEMESSAVAYVRARDFVIVTDFSGSMCYDSRTTSSLPSGGVAANLDAMWDALVDQQPTWTSTSTLKFPSTGFGGINSYSGGYHSSNSVSGVFNSLNLGAASNGQPAYPFPWAGKSNGNYNPMPSQSSSDAKWQSYISFVMSHPKSSYRKKYNYRTLMDYMLQSSQWGNNKCEELWRTPHYPFHANKEGITLFLNFLEDLGYGDEVGLVSYGTTAQVESVINEVDGSEDISNDPITNDLDAVDFIQRHKQAAHYSPSTGMGDGILKGKQLQDGYHRCGAQAALIVMTDGNTNKKPSGWSLPSNWNWANVTDWDGDGSPNYTTSNSYKQYAFYEAYEAIKAGYLIHTVTVGNGADDDLMEAIARSAGGVWLDIPGGTSVQQMQSQVMDAFAEIAASVPPATLIDENAAANGYGGDNTQQCQAYSGDNGSNNGSGSSGGSSGSGSNSGSGGKSGSGSKSGSGGKTGSGSGKSGSGSKSGSTGSKSSSGGKSGTKSSSGGKSSGSKSSGSKSSGSKSSGSKSSGSKSSGSKSSGSKSSGSKSSGSKSSGSKSSGGKSSGGKSGKSGGKGKS